MAETFPARAAEMAKRYGVQTTPDAAAVVKAADSISAYVKCIEEKRAGNREFEAAGVSIRKSLAEIDLPEVQDFLRMFLPSFELSLDELNGGGAE